ncbi:MAG: hypothetical protein CME65_02930 [Halobacteriovoraceae bacterium]|nr:hypothetical protein [Halobacteriovoraceae bacterium]
MNATNLSLIILMLMTFNSFAQESESSTPPVLTGAAGPIDSENPNLITFRTEDRNYQLNMEASGFPPALRQQLQNNIENPRIESFNIPSNAIVSSERIPFGTRGDCNELPITCDDLTDIVRAGGEDMQLLDFLRAIPGGTLEGFTFITNTRSLQRGEGSHLVDEENPRVIRQSIDGKVTISFVCHPEQDKHNSVEIICFNDETESFETLSYNFSNPVGEGEGRRIEENPQSCISCHGTSDKNGVEGSGAQHIKLNWPEYFFWGDCNPERGITMYGMSDDNMCSGNFRARLGDRSSGPSYSFDGCSRAADRATHEGLIADFSRFRQQAQTNECLGTLPWATLPEEGQERVGLELAWTNEDYSNYPYACRAQKQVTNDPTNIPDNPKSDRIGNYSLRTNARMTDTYGHLTARRNARLFRDNPRYDQFKYYLAMEGLRDCLTPQERQEFADRMGITVDPSPSSTRLAPQRFPLARAYGEQVVGFGTNDWTMHPPAHLSSNPRASTDVYNTVIFSDSNTDHSILDVTLG